MSEESFVNDLLNTRKIRKKRSISRKSYKDRNQINARIQNNGVKIDLVTEILETIYGGHFTVGTLLKYAQFVAHKNKIKIDRLAYRSRDALICWFVENWTIIFPELKHFSPTKQEKIKSELNIKEARSNENALDPSDIHQLLNHH